MPTTAAIALPLAPLSGGAVQHMHMPTNDVTARMSMPQPATIDHIANAIIALETGVATDPETPLPWDGKQYARDDWNRDHTLRSAIQVSCVPCFQAIARNVGQPRMDDWLARLGYGNRDTSGGIDRFWLWGGLRISPIEQIDFLRRLEGGKLPRVYVSTDPAELIEIQGEPQMTPIDGTKLLYVKNTSSQVLLDVNTQEMASIGEATPLPIVGFAQAEYRRQFDLMPDGRQFLVLFPVSR